MLLTRNIEWIDSEAGGVKPVFVDRSRGEVLWAPQAGSQELLLCCPVLEALYEGTRGPGKTEALLNDFSQHCGSGFGSAWRGVLFRKTYKQLADVIAKSKRLYGRVFPEARFLASEGQLRWVFSGGEELLFRVLKNADDYDDYHGHEYPWIGFEELTRWPDDIAYKRMFSCCRTSHPGIEQEDGTLLKVPRKIRATTNPYGVGHGWVKARFQLPHKRFEIIRGEIDPDTGRREPDRVAIFGRLSENKILLASDPDYESNIAASARNSSEKRAWLFGDWDITAGGMFDDVWDGDRHVIPQFEIPSTWRIDRSFDWGSSKPFAVLWWAESDGSPIRFPNGKSIETLPGDLFLVHEWYGCRQGMVNEGLRMVAKDIAKGVKDRESTWLAGREVMAGPADSSIFDDVNGVSIERDMRNAGVRWKKSNKGPGSRKQGWQKMRDLMAGAVPESGNPREEPGIFVCEHCEHFIRTVPPLPRSDKDLDDVDTESEDHIGDAARYRIYQRRNELSVTTVSGR